MTLELRDGVVVLAGATSGMGRAAAIELGEDGAEAHSVERSSSLVQ